MQLRMCGSLACSHEIKFLGNGRGEFVCLSEYVLVLWLECVRGRSMCSICQFVLFCCY
jgi:hypothetical protein